MSLLCCLNVTSMSLVSSQGEYGESGTPGMKGTRVSTITLSEQTSPSLETSFYFLTAFWLLSGLP